MTRKQSRDIAFKLLYQMDMQKESAEYIAEMYFGSKENLSEETKEYITNILLGTELNRENIDGFIAENSANWSIGRISPLSAAALRLGIFEIIYCADIPDTVAANEAVTLVKTYETEESAGFVNGILATVISSKVKE